ncbi:MAG: type II toxin-antitoxin system HicA family toxin [Verrucomicrobiae bacterium]|nr:type II toxin-antitoxin system HicA family toxin [Verrucomicrobiae bacterium]
MSKTAKILHKILSGQSDASILFPELGYLLEKLGFSVRIRGSHHIFYREGVEEIINLQSRGKNAKPYQVRQVRALILKYKLGGAL